MGTWVTNTFGGFNECFYENVFDLLLRLKGNFLWPAMWSAVFSEDGSAYPTASAELADELGIYMGTSHHEPLFRAGEEFSHYRSQDNSEGYGADLQILENITIKANYNCNLTLCVQALIVVTENKDLIKSLMEEKGLNAEDFEIEYKFY